MIASFVIGFHTARIDNLLQTLRFLVTDHASIVKHAELHAICQDDCESLPKEQFDQLDTIREAFHKSCITSLSLKQMRLPYVTNFGIKNAECDQIIVLESDRILPAGYFAEALSKLRDGVQITCLSMKKLKQPATDEDIRAGKFEYVDETRNQKNKLGMRNIWSGNTIFMRSDWERADRMDEAYKGYGWADSDMTRAMEVVGVQSVFLTSGTELHLWHPSATYGDGDQKKMFIDNGLYYCKKWEEPLPIWFIKEITQHKKVML